MINEVIAKSSEATYIASAGTIVAGLAFNEWIALGGLTLAILTFIVNWVYRHKTFNHLKDK